MMIDFIFICTTILCLAYAGQLSLAIFSASEPRTDNSTVLSALISRTDIADTWTTIGITFVVPVMISWTSSVFDLFHEKTRVDTALTGCLSMLFVLITLELSLLSSIKQNGKSWKGLLTFALSLDLLSVVLLVGGVKTYLAQPLSAGWEAVSTYVTLIGFFALVSSFCVVLFARKAEEYEQK